MRLMIRRFLTLPPAALLLMGAAAVVFPQEPPGPAPAANPDLVKDPVRAAARPAAPPVADQILVFLRPGVDAREFARAEGLAYLSTLLSDPNAHVFAAPAAGAARTRAIAHPGVRKAFLNRRLPRVKCPFVPDDPYYNNDNNPPGFPGQWHLGNGSTTVHANTAGAWSRDVTGDGVVIGIVDDGLETSHPDLAPNYDPDDSWDFGQNDNDPNPVLVDDNHGTSVSGVAAARGGNGTGVTGAAPRARLAGLRINFKSGTEAMFVDATQYHSSGGITNVKIKNHSYGYSVPYIEAQAERDAAAVSAAAGTIHCFAGGNERGGSGQDSNKQDVQSSPDVIAVAALGSNGTYSDYSSFGANVFVTAPSSTSGGYRITTTDRTGGKGYNTKTNSTDGDAFPDTNYTSTFGGTSSASPLAAGVLALVKQVRPNLDVRFAKHLLARTSDVVDPNDPTETGGGDGTTPGSAWIVNAAGLKFNQNYGFGVIDADGLTQEALLYSGVTPLQTETTGTVSVGASIPDNNPDGVLRTFTVAASMSLEEVLVTLSVTHTFRGDLEARLRSPGGTTGRLMIRSGTDSADNINWTFVSNAFWGENPRGTWTLTLSDRFANDTGTWDSFVFTARMGQLVAVTTPPSVVSVVRAGASPTHASSVDYTITFNRAVVGVDAEDFVLAGTVSGASVTGIAGGGNVYTVTVATGSGDGTLRLDVVDNDTIRDVLDVPLGGAGAGNGDFASGESYTLDRTVPSVSHVTSSAANGTYTAGAPVDVTVDFTEPVTLLGGNLRVTLDTGDVVVIGPFGPAATASGTYTVGTGDNSGDLNAANPLTLSGGTLRDAAGNDCTLTVPAGQNLGDLKDLVIDTMPPGVASVTSSTANGTYTAGASINVTVNFTEPVTLLGGNLQVTLDTGDVVTISPFVLATTASGTYTVGAGDNSGDLNAANPLTLSGGTLGDAGGNPCALTIPAGQNLGDLKGIVVDTGMPAVSSVTSTTANGIYTVGASINVTVNFTEPVTLLGGNLQVALDTGDVVTIGPFGPTAVASGTYLVGAGDSSGDLNAANPLTLTGGTIKDGAGNNCSLDIPSGQNLADLKSIVVDAGIPAVSSVTSSTPNGMYGVGASINVTVTFTELVTLAGGDLQVTLDTGDVVAIAPFVLAATASGTYTVGAGDNSADLNASSPLTLSAGTMRDAAGNDCTLTVPAGQSLGDLKNLAIDTVAPGVARVTSSTANGTYGVGATVNVTVNFTEPVTLSGGNLRVTLDTGDVVVIGPFGPAATASGTYMVEAGDNSANLNVTNPLTLSGGTLKDAAGNDCALAVPAGQNLGDLKNLVIDTTLPGVASVTSDSPDGTYGLGEPINVKVTFTEPVTLAGGDLRVTLDTGDVVAIAPFVLAATASGTYTVGAGDNSGDLNATNPLALSAGTIKDAAGNDCTLIIPAGQNLENLKNLVVDTTPPGIVSVTSATPDGTYIEGNPIDVTVNFTEPVTLAGGNLQITLDTGGTVSIDPFGPSTTVSGTYTVAKDENSMDLDSVSPLELQGATLKDAAGNDCALSIPSDQGLADLKAIVIDTAVPSVLGVDLGVADGIYGTGAVIPVRVTFTEAVQVIGTPRLTLETGSADAVVDYSGGTGTTVLTFSYTVAAGHESADLEYVSTAALALNGGMIRDGAGNDALLALPAPGGAGSISDDRSVIVDTTAPMAGTVNDGFSPPDIDTQTSVTTISANWTAFDDPQSGIAGYEWAIGTAAGATDIRPFESIGLRTCASTSAVNETLALAPGSLCYVTVRATNGAGRVRTASSDGVRVSATDTEAPEAPGYAIALSLPQAALVEWGASPSADVLSYQVWWKPSSDPWIAATRVNGLTDGSAVIPGLVNGTAYDFLVQAVDAAGNESEGIIVSTVPRPLITIDGEGDYATLQDALAASMPGETVVLGPGTFAGGATLPAGVSLSGASPFHTILAGTAGVTVISVAGTYLVDTAITIGNLAVTGGALGVDAGSADVVLDHVVIHHVLSHAVSSGVGGCLRALHCTIVSNGGDGIRASGLSTVRHCIVVKNAGTGLNLAAGAAVEYNDVFQNTVANYGVGITGIGNISALAAFLNEAASDYRDASASPTVDAGDPADAVGSEPAPNGGRINQGVTGGTVWAATTPQPVPEGGGGRHKKRCGLLGPELLLPLLWLRFRDRSPRRRR